MYDPSTSSAELSRYILGVVNLLEQGVDGVQHYGERVCPALTNFLCRAILQVSLEQRNKKDFPDKFLRFSAAVLGVLNGEDMPPWKQLESPWEPTSADRIVALSCLQFFSLLNNDIPNFVPSKFSEKMQEIARVPKAVTPT